MVPFTVVVWGYNASDPPPRRLGLLPLPPSPSGGSTTTCYPSCRCFVFLPLSAARSLSVRVALLPSPLQE